MGGNVDKGKRQMKNKIQPREGRGIPDAQRGAVLGVILGLRRAMVASLEHLGISAGGGARQAGWPALHEAPAGGRVL